MNKFTVIFIFVISLVFSNTSNATLITDSSLLTSDNYVTFVGDGVTIDFAWASPVNVEYWGNPNLETTNRLYEPDSHQGWGYASSDDLDLLLLNFTLDDFSNIDGTYIQAVSFWNSYYTDIVLRFTIAIDGELVELVDRENLKNYAPGGVSSFWASAGVDGQNATGSENETFYVRKTFTNNSTPVPEPSTLMIFALGLIALASKKRLFSSK